MGAMAGPAGTTYAGRFGVSAGCVEVEDIGVEGDPDGAPLVDVAPEGPVEEALAGAASSPRCPTMPASRTRTTSPNRASVSGERRRDLRVEVTTFL
jgi:hypothetical protein